MAQRLVESGQLSAREDFEFWDGICPGSTTFDEAVRLLEAQHGKQNVTVDQRANRIRWESDKDDRFPRGSIYIQQNAVKVIELRVYQLTVEDLNDQLGNPAFVDVVVSFSPDYPCAGAIIRYPDRGVLADPDQEYGSNTIGIIPTQGIVGLTIMPPEETRDWFMYDTVAVPWRGYTDYCKLAFPNEFEGNG
jgi:hypothetical protein